MPAPASGREDAQWHAQQDRGEQRDRHKLQVASRVFRDPLDDPRSRRPRGSACSCQVPPRQDAAACCCRRFFLQYHQSICADHRRFVDLAASRCIAANAGWARRADIEAVQQHGVIAGKNCLSSSSNFKPETTDLRVGGVDLDQIDLPVPQSPLRELVLDAVDIIHLQAVVVRAEALKPSFRR